MARSQRVRIAAEGTDGHRQAYLDFLSGLLNAQGASVSIGPLRWADTCRPEPLFSAMLEEHPARFALIAALRGLCGRRSVSLLFRVREVVHAPSLRLKTKQLILRLLRLVPGVSILSIVPLAVEPALRPLVAASIYDLQFWDVQPADRDRQSALADQIRAAARGRLILVALGGQNRSKGFGLLTDIMSGDAALRDRFLAVAAGPVATDEAEVAERFVAAGGILANRFISEDELFSLYHAADLIWACYAPEYDQSSGILGRAVQIPRPAIVRQGSQAESIAASLGAALIALPWDVNAAASALRDMDLPVAATSADAGEESRAALFRALGISAR